MNTLTAAVCARAAKRSPMASRMLQPVLMTPNADTSKEGQSKVRSAMQARGSRLSWHHPGPMTTMPLLP